MKREGIGKRECLKFVDYGVLGRVRWAEVIEVLARLQEGIVSLRHTAVAFKVIRDIVSLIVGGGNIGENTAGVQYKTKSNTIESAVICRNGGAEIGGEREERDLLRAVARARNFDEPSTV